jgi:hypothetical protein
MLHQLFLLGQLGHLRDWQTPNSSHVRLTTAVAPRWHDPVVHLIDEV